MKKGIVMEKRRKYVIVLTADGFFEKGIASDPEAGIGEEISYQPYRTFGFANFAFLTVKFALLTGIFLFFLCAGRFFI
mgnify:CR=1 FL=1